MLMRAARLLMLQRYAASMMPDVYADAPLAQRRARKDVRAS